MALATLFIILALSNSVGNILEITSMLDTEKYNSVQIAENYGNLVQRWGVWQITAVGGVSIEYVNIKNALFNGLSTTYLTLTILSISLSLIVGKLLFPILAKQYTNQNDQLVDLATLKTQEIVNKKENKNGGDWF